MNGNGQTNQAKYRNALPQLSDGIFLTDGGLETTLVFHEGFDLPEFAAFDLFKNTEGYQALHNYYDTYARIAKKYGLGFILESATWRASQDWGQKIGYSAQELADVNDQAIKMLIAMRAKYEDQNTKMVISGCVGPRGDGYIPGSMMTAAEAEAYHRAQVETLAETGADMITAITMTYAEESIGVVRAAQAVGIPVVISFTVETDGSLPSGQPLKAAIQQVDEATDSGPAYYMINCAHPTHFKDALNVDEDWVQRIRGIRANASRLSHAELDEAEVLDDGDPVELGSQYLDLRDNLRHLSVLGGCCGTDHRHIEAICRTYLQ
ncbi:MAG: homocysteine S-methyltransferase family protein [Anaerolineales bacterium]|nr:homocysteine S-methyltransferase family protein [Anaerolineales bacterium]